METGRLYKHKHIYEPIRSQDKGLKRHILKEQRHILKEQRKSAFCVMYGLFW